jgi:hypothetical protein
MTAGTARTTITIERADLTGAARLLWSKQVSAATAFNKYEPLFRQHFNTGRELNIGTRSYEVVDVVTDSTNRFLPTLTALVRISDRERARLGLPAKHDASF